jgi:ribosome-associated toxin RatA of RatAB toxin-antitoxin module
LHGEWRFTTLAEDACKVEFELAYEFTTHLLERVVGPVFGHIANTFIDAFVRRAESVYAVPT